LNFRLIKRLLLQSSYLVQQIKILTRMKFWMAFAVILFAVKTTAQPKYNARLLDTLHQIAATNTPAKYFAQLYYNAILATNTFAASKPDSVRNFIFGFESLFAPTFFQSYQNYIQHGPQVFSWQQYYSDTTLNELQYQFIGMNDHINGDMWLALKDKYGYDTLQKYRKDLLHFQKTLNTFFDSIYVASGRFKKIKHLHLFTFGADKIMGRQMILHWRKRQLHMALLYYRNPKKCAIKLRHLEKRMAHYNSFALHWIK
jgi:hypothetical protein